VAAPDEIIHQSTRLKIVSVLNGLSSGEALEFNRLKALLKVTDGNLGAHLAALERAGYIRSEKDFAGKKPRTRASLTKEGRRAFARHVEFLQNIISGTGEADGSERNKGGNRRRAAS
jgi:DNA-binding MarR family transcriptional regulator